MRETKTKAKIAVESQTKALFFDIKRIAAVVFIFAFILSIPQVIRILAANTPIASSVSPTFAVYGVGTNVRINGTSLTSTVQFFDSTGNRYTVAGVVNGSGTQTTVAFPSGIPVGPVTIKVYSNQNSVSNDLQFKVKDIKDVVNFAKPTSTWSPQQTDNGWWPKLSPDGRYVIYGNWGQVWITDLKTKKNYDFSRPKGLPSNWNCSTPASAWIQSNVATFVCTDNGARNDVGYNRYEVKVGEWIAKKTKDSSDLLGGNWIWARDGHWASYTAVTRIVKDNKILVAHKSNLNTANPGGAMAIQGDYLMHACTNDNVEICVYQGQRLIKKFPVKTAYFGGDIFNGYIAYGGYGAVRGINLQGKDVELSATGKLKMLESIPQIVSVANKPWIATDPWNSYIQFMILRPWGDRAGILVDSQASAFSVVYANNSFIVASCTDKGKLIVQTIPANSPRVDLFNISFVK